MKNDDERVDFHMAVRRWLTFIFLVLRIFSHGGWGSVRATFVHKRAALDSVY